MPYYFYINRKKMNVNITVENPISGRKESYKI